MKVYTALSVATLYVALAGLCVHAGGVGNLRRLTPSARQAEARSMLRGFTLTDPDNAPVPDREAITEDEDSGIETEPQGGRAVGVSWVPSDFRTGKVSLLPTFPPSVSDSPVMVPSIVPTTRGRDVSWILSNYHAESEALLPVFAPKPTPARTTTVDDESPVGVSWMPSDFRTGNVTRLPVFSHSPTTESPTQSTKSSVPSMKAVGVSWMPSDLRTGKVTRLPLFPPAPTASRNTQAERDS